MVQAQICISGPQQEQCARLWAQSAPAITAAAQETAALLSAVKSLNEIEALPEAPSDAWVAADNDLTTSMDHQRKLIIRITSQLLLEILTPSQVSPGCMDRAGHASGWESCVRQHHQ